MGAPLVAEHGLLAAVASLLAEQGFSACALQRWSTGSVVVAHGFSCSTACGSSLGRGLGTKLEPHHRILSPKRGAFLDPMESVFQEAKDSPSKCDWAASVSGDPDTDSQESRKCRSP